MVSKMLVGQCWPRKLYLNCIWLPVLGFVTVIIIPGVAFPGSVTETAVIAGAAVACVSEEVSLRVQHSSAGRFV